MPPAEAKWMRVKSKVSNGHETRDDFEKFSLNPGQMAQIRRRTTFSAILPHRDIDKHSKLRDDGSRSVDHDKINVALRPEPMQ